MDNETMVAVTPELQQARAICSAHYRKRARDPRNSYGHEMAHAARIDDGQSDDWDCVQTTLTAITEASRHQSGRTGAGERETVARVIHQCLRPVNMAKADWDSGAILGANNSWRRSVYSTTDAILAALSQSTAGEDGPKWVYDIQWGPEGQQDYAHVYDLGGNLIAVMKTHDAARVAKHRGGDQ